MFRSVIVSILLFSKLTTFLDASLSPVKVDCDTYKSFASIIFKSAGIISPAESIIISPTVIWFKAIFSSLPFLNTNAFVSIRLFSFSAALFYLNTSKNSNKVLTAVNISITIMFE